MLNLKKIPKNYAAVSLCFVIVFLMTPVVSNPGDLSHNGTDSNLPIFDDRGLAASTENFDSSISNVDGSPDIGTHSNLANQQAGPDSTYDTLLEGNGAPPPTNSEDDIDSDSSDVDSTPDVGIEGTFANAQGTDLDSSYFALSEESVISPYGGETGAVFVTGSVPDMAGSDQYCLYQAIFWNPTDDVYEVTRVEFSYTGSNWLNAIQQGSGSSFPTSGWSLSSTQVAYWTSGTPITVQPHTASSFYVRGDSNKIRTEYYIDIGITANSSTYTESYHSEQNRNRPAAQLWLDEGAPPNQIHSVSTGTSSTVYVSLEEDTGLIDILSGGILTIDVPSGFTGITSVGGTNWGSATINGNQITVSNTATIRGSYLTYGFQITSPSTPGLYKLNIAYDDGSNAHPIGNFTIHVIGTPPSVEKINLEYQWSTATYSEAYEEVCIYVGSHTGSENLAVNYWDGFTWNVLGTISTTGWNNFTATGLSSATYIVQLIGSSETSDSSKDTWNIDLITLHTWSLQTYNYKLDIEIQWTTANYTQDFEELCIYAGSLATESIRIDIWTGAAWTNIATDLTANSWNNISIGTWLTSATLTIRFRGDLEVGDTTQSSWEIDCSLLHTWDNEVPTNSATPVISNLDDTTFLYAAYRQYQLTAEVSDLDGFSEIDYVELTLISDDNLTEYWSIRYDEDTGNFTEQSDPSDYITLDAGSSSALKAGNTISATFFITINWNHPNVVNTDIKSEVFDANPSSSLDYFEVNWDIETRLDLSSGPTLNDGSGTSTRGDLDGSMTASGTITYLGSSLHPSAGDIDVWISSSEYGSQIGPWEAINYEDTGGTFSITVYADNAVGLDTFTFKAVEQGTGATGNDLFSSSETTQYIADRVQVQSYSTDDPRINVNTTASLHVVLYYDYDNSYVIDGTVIINGRPATYNGSNGVWDFTDEKSTVQLVTYNSIVYSGGTHGITGEDQNGQSIGQIWDYVRVVSYSVVDSRVNVGSSATIDVTLVYHYDGAFVTSGSVTVNSISATHQGSGVWRFTDSKASVQSFTYDTVDVSGNTHGITTVDQNSQTQDVIWDRILVIGYFVTDDRVDVDASVNIDVTLEYEYDNATVTDGSVTINLVAASNQGSGIWRISVLKSTVQAITYNLVACSGNSFGITVVNQNSQSQEIIWDRVIVISYSTSDNRVGLADLVDVNVTIRYQYDNTPVTLGTVTINLVSATHLENGIWRISDFKSSVQAFTYDTVACSSNNYDITAVNQNSKSTTVIWDQIIVRSYTVLDNRVNLNDLVNVDVLLEFEYDDSDVTDATVTINTLPATYVSGGTWRITVSQSSVQSLTYNSVTCSDNTYEISSISQNGQSAIVIWDQIVVRSYSVSDDRTDIGISVDISFIIEYEYDDSTVTDGSVSLNGYAAAFSAGSWHISQSRATVQSVTYNSVACSGNLYGINDVNQNSQSTSVIWDQIVVRSYTVIDNRVNIDDSVNIDVFIQYEYDDSNVTDGTVTINTFSATYQSGGTWRISQTQATVQGVTYNTVACSGNTHGITSVNQASQSQLVIWDQITVAGYEISDARDNVDDPITITVQLEYEYDGSFVTIGTISINSLPFTYTGSLGKWSASRTWSTVRDETFATVIVSSSDHGITSVNQDGQSQTAIWDRIQVLTTTVDDGRISTGTSCEIRVTLMLEYDSTLLGSGDTVVLNGVSMTWDGINTWFEVSRSQSTVGLWTYYVNSSLETTYGISALNLNSQEVSVIWDRIRILTTTVDDNRVSVDSSVELRVTAELEYDNHLLTSGDTIFMDGVSMSWDAGNSRFILSRSKSVVSLYNFQVGSALETTYGISSINLNGQSQDVIWDRLNIVIIADLDTVENDVQVNFTMIVTYDYDSVVCTTFNIVVFRNNTYWNTFTNLNVSDFWDTNSATIYQYNATLVNSESIYGITVFSTNIETVSWGSGVTAPINSLAPLLTNPDDSSVMYARLRFYLITSRVSDANGYADIAYVYLSLWDNTRFTEIWRIRYNASSNVFDVIVGNEYIELGPCSFTTSVFSIDLTWSIKIDWDHQDVTNVDVKQYVIDSTSEFDENWYEADWDVETRLNYSVSPSLSDYRGDLNTNDLECNGTVVYYGSSLHPLANETDIWVSHDVSGVWPGDIDGSGVFSITSIASSAFVRLNTYTIKVVAQGGGSGGSDLYYTTSATDTFITDRIEFYQSGADSARVNINENGVVWWSARYEYDNVTIVSGLSAQLNGSNPLLWDSVLSRWYFVDILSNVGRISYNILSASESGYGLTGWRQTASDASIIWDQVVVRSYEANSLRTNVSDVVEIDVLLEYEYDNSWVTGGIVDINSIPAVYQGEGKWRILESRSSVTSVTYDSVVCSLNFYNITSVNQNSQSISIIWDRIIVESYSISDTRITIGDSVTINVTLSYEYDSTSVTDGYVTIIGFPASHLVSGIWQITQSRGTIQTVTYDTVVCYGNLNGIAVVNQNSQSEEIIWDQIIVQYYTVLDNRVNVDGTAIIDVVLHYWYDDLPVTDGSVSINGIVATHQGSGTWRFTDSQSSVQSVTYDTVVCSGNIHGINSVDPNGQSTSVIFDEVAVRGYSVDGNRVDIGAIVTINVTLEYAYDNASVVNGIVLIQSVSATHVGNGIWQITMMKSTVQSVLFNTIVCSSNSFGISSVNQNGQQQDVIWDKVVVRSYSVTDSRVNINDSVNIDVLLEFEYDDTPVTTGTVTINGASAIYQGAGVWRIIDTQSTVQSVTYDTVTSSGNDHEISTIDQNGKSQSVIWDRVIVISYQVLDSRVDIDDLVDIDVSLEFEFDGTDVTNGSIQINGIDADYVSGNIWRISVSESLVTSNLYDTVTCSGNNYGISIVNANGKSIEVIWDRIIVRAYSVSDDRGNVGSTITVYVTLQFEYDDSNVTMGNVIVNSIPFTYTGADGIWFVNRMQSSVTLETYSSTIVSGTNYGITVVNQNGLSTTIIWDRIRILTTNVDDSRINTDATARIMVTAELEYDHHLLGLGDTLTLDGSLMTWDNGNGCFYLDVTQSSVGLRNYFVNSTGALESTYEITQITIAGVSQSVIWDELSITITPDETSVYDYDVVSFTLDISYVFDSSICTSYTLEISRNGTYWATFTNLNVSQFMDTNIAVTYNYSTFDVTGESTYGITIFSTNWVEVSWTTPANFVPFNNGAPTLLNPHDTDNMYARLGLYFITSSFVDYDGYTDIDYVELSLWDDFRNVEVWRIRYTLATQIFSIEIGLEYIFLSGGSIIGNTNLLNVTWAIKIDWDHFDYQNVDLEQYVQDKSEFSDHDWFESDWDVETRLYYSVMPYLSDDHGDIDTVDLQASGTVIYYGSSNIHPLSNETTIWVIHDFSGSWSGTANANGVITITGIGSSSTVRLNTYTFKIVPAGSGSASADLFYTTSPTDTFITDRIEFYQSGVTDSRININSQGDVWFKARYQYDLADIQGGFEAYLNGIKLLTWDAINNRWHYQETRSSASKILYQLSSATESNFGITTWILNTADQSIIWDSLIITITDPVDRRININENATGIIVSARYSYDSTPFNGTVLLNNTVFQYSSVQRQYYTVSMAFGDLYGITYISVNDLTWCIWDQIEVVSITTDFTYLDPAEYVRVQTELRYDFDDSPVETGNFSLKFIALVHTADGVWEANVTRLSYQSINFDTLTICEGTSFGISSFDMYGNVRVVYWDRLEIYESNALDSRIDVGSTGFIIWSIRLQNAGITITSGVIAEVSDGSPLTYINDGWRSAHSSELVGDITFAVVSASLEGIDFFISSTNDETIIWDRIRVVTTSATSTTPEIETFIQIQVTLIFEYDDTPVTSGVVSLWDDGSQISMTYNVSGGFWYANVTKVDIGNYTFYISATSGNLYGITVVDLDNIIITVEFVPALLPRLTPMMIFTISSGFGIILLASAVFVRKKYLVKIPYEIKQINRALKSMEKGEKVEPLDLRGLEHILFAELEPGLTEIGLVIEEVLGDISPDEVKDTWVPDSETELLDIMDEFKIPEYKQELDEGELDISILSESESEEAWTLILKEVRRIESEEGRKVPLTKDDWIERIPSEIKSVFFEEELRELGVSELEHLTHLTPAELEEIMSSISQTEDMYASLEPEASAAAISSAISDRIEAQPTVELDETEKKERLFELLPSFVKEYFSSSWLEKLSCEEIEELLIIPEPELKAVIAHIAGSQEATSTAKVELEPIEEVLGEPEVEVTEEVVTEAEIDEKTQSDEPRKRVSPADLQAELIAELKSELGPVIDDEPESESNDEYVIESEEEVHDLKEVLELEFEAEPTSDDESSVEIEDEHVVKSDEELSDDLMDALDLEFEVEPEDDSEPEE